MVSKEEIVIAVVAPVGVDVDQFCQTLSSELQAFEYSSTEIRLSALLVANTPNDPGIHDPNAGVRLLSRMQAGSQLRRSTGRGDVLALLAIAEIDSLRRAADPESQPPKSLGRHAFIIRSLKTPQELDTLRSVYGSRLFVVGAYSPSNSRRDELAEMIQQSADSGGARTQSPSLEILISTDADEGDPFGQNVDKTFHQSDAFVTVSASQQDQTQLQMQVETRRLVRVLMGDPFVTPSRDEFSLFQAEGASLRSSELTRQVGAAIVDPGGSVIALGCNEVPRFGGGSYWEGDEGDAREFVRASEFPERRGTNDAIRQETALHIVSLLQDILPVDDPDMPELDALLDAIGLGLDGMTEFGRAVHAEMNALLDAAARGVPVRGTTLYATTFPCHTCTRHMIAAGISRVVYVTPYARSRAEDLHGDSVVVAPPTIPDDKMVIEPFVGIAPRRYLEFFGHTWRATRSEIVQRCDEDERLVKFTPSTMTPLIVDLDKQGLSPTPPAYRQREDCAIVIAERLANPS